MINHRWWENGTLVREVTDQIEISENIGKAMDELRALPIPVKWPPWAKALKQFSKPEDKGIGDVAARTIGAENSEAFKRFFKATFGKDCGCNGRQSQWNMKYPLP